MQPLARFSILLILLLMIPAMSDSKRTYADRMWEVTCTLVAEHRDYSCGDLKAPKMVYKIMPEGLDGYFPGGDTIYVSVDLDFRDRKRTIVHEMIHYLHQELGMLVLPGPTQMVCWSESESWVLEGLYTSKDRSRWWVNYPQCYYWYATDIYEYETS